MSDDAVKLTRTDPAGNITELGIQPLTVMEDIFQVFGGRLYDERTGQITPDDPNNVRALTWYKSLVDRLGGYEKVNAFSSGFGAQQSANNPFFVGKVAMKWDGEWTPYWIKKYAPGMQYGVGPLPPPADRPDRARSTWLGGNVFCIPKDSKHPNEAWDLMVWMQSDEAQIYFASMMNNVPNTRSALHSPRLRTGAPYRFQYGKFLDLADSPNAGSFPALPVANLYSAELQNARDYALAGTKTPQQALHDVRVRVQRELDRYH
jgi:multiple sugar transport system substrate-binding protein